MKDGRTHLAHKAEHAIDLDSGALVAVTLHGADVGDTTSVGDTVVAAIEQAAAAQAGPSASGALTALVADKGYHSNQTLIDLDAIGVRSYIAEPNRGRRQWMTAPDAQRAVYGNRRRVRGGRGQRWLRRRGEYVERSFAHVYDTGGMRRTHLRGHRNILKRLLVHASAFNLGLLMRSLCGRGTPRGLQGRRLDARSVHVALLMLSARFWMTIGAPLAHCRRPPRVLHPHPGWAIAC
jgi:transposase